MLKFEGHNRTNKGQEINIWEVRNLVTSLVRICIPVVWKPVYIFFLHWPSVVPQIVLFAKCLIKVGDWYGWLYTFSRFLIPSCFESKRCKNDSTSKCMWKVKSLMPNKLRVIDILSILWIAVSKWPAASQGFLNH